MGNDWVNFFVKNYKSTIEAFPNAKLYVWKGC